MKEYDIDKYGSTNLKWNLGHCNNPDFLYYDETDTSKTLHNPNNISIPIDWFRSQVDDIFSNINNELILQNYNEIKKLLEKLVFIFLTSVGEKLEENPYKYFKIQNWPKNGAHCNLKDEFLIKPIKEWKQIQIEYRLNDKYTDEKFINENYLPESNTVLIAIFDIKQKLTELHIPNWNNNMKLLHSY